MEWKWFEMVFDSYTILIMKWNIFHIDTMVTHMEHDLSLNQQFQQWDGDINISSEQPLLLYSSTVTCKASNAINFLLGKFA